MSFWSDVIDVVSGMMGGEANITNPQGAVVSDAATGAGLFGLVTTIEGIWADVTNGKMWRSLGWLILGIVLMLLGVAWWIGPSAARMSPLGVARRAVT